MALTVTPGSATADAFVSVAACDTYCTARGLTDWTGAADSPADVKEAAIRRATAYLCNAFAWKGLPTSGRTQALAWPRAEVCDADGYAVPTDTIPREIVDACCEIAVREIVTPGYMSPDVVLTDRIKAESIGPISTTYADNGAAASASRPVLLLVRDMVAGLLSAGSGAIRLDRS
jgi:hypothetical protein